MKAKYLLTLLLVSAFALLLLFWSRAGGDGSRSLVAELATSAAHEAPPTAPRVEAPFEKRELVAPLERRQESQAPSVSKGGSSAPTKLLAGTIVVPDELGTEHAAESGSFSLTSWDGTPSNRHDVMVDAGTWKIEIPALQASDLVTFTGIVLGDRAASLLPTHDERFAIPLDGRFALRARWVPDTLLHVRDRQTGRELSPVLVNGPTFGETAFDHPGADAERAIEHRSSPVRIPPAKGRTFNSTGAFRVWSPGYAWGEIRPGVTTKDGHGRRSARARVATKSIYASSAGAK